MRGRQVRWSVGAGQESALALRSHDQEEELSSSPSQPERRRRVYGYKSGRAGVFLEHKGNLQLLRMGLQRCIGLP